MRADELNELKELIGDKNTVNLFVSAGEASGDKYGAEIINELKNKLKGKPQILSAWGMGGKDMKAAGVELLQDSSELGIIGVADLLKNLFFFVSLEKKIINEIKLRKPNVALLIDYPGFNLRIAKAIKKECPNCKVIFFVAPQVWAWNKKRINEIPNIIDRLLVILPFEEEMHLKAGTSTRFVGNPSYWYMKQIENFDRDEILLPCGIDRDANPNQRVIGIFPGSRNREIDFMLPVFLKAVMLLKRELPETEFVLVRAKTIKFDRIKNHFKRLRVPKDLIKILEPEASHYMLRAVDIAWLTSGTVTLEAACAETPLMLGYKENPAFWMGYLFFRNISRIGLPNIIANEDVCPELLQDDCKPENWANLTRDWIERRQLPAIKAELVQKVKEPIGFHGNPFENVASEVLLMHKINVLSKENQQHMRKRAEQNSDETRRKAAKDRETS